MQFFFKVF
jgi:putative AlgH/UPF0301 family transcriptional regulator